MLYAIEMLKLLESRKRIFNFDESWINWSTYIRKHWVSKNEPATINNRVIIPRIAILAAIDTSGNIYYALTQSNTDSKVLGLFL